MRTRTSSLRSSLLLVGGALLVLPGAATAQRLAPEQRIRITAPQLHLRHQPGRLVWVDADSLVLAGPTNRWVVPRHLLTQVDYSQGTRGHTLTGLAVGAAAGFAFGAIFFSPNSNACTGSGDYAKNCRLYRAGIVIGGAGLGALVGSLIRSERWAPVRSLD